MRKKTLVTLSVICAVFLGLLIWAIYENKALELKTITVSSAELPESFDGFRIAHISDLHSTQIGKNNSKLIAIIHMRM